MRATSVCTFAAAFLFGGCASSGVKKYAVQVDAMSAPSGPTGYAYTLSEVGAARPGRDARDEDAADLIHRALSQRGMYVSEDAKDADYVISYSYGERAPRTEVNTVTQPVMVQSNPMGGGMMGGGPGIGIGIGGGGPSIGISGGVGGVGIGSGGYPQNSPYGSGGMGPYSSGGRYGSGAPQVVMVETPELVRKSEKYLQISARENPNARERNGKPPAELWRVEAIIDDETVDIHKSIPALVDAVVEYMGTNTDGPQKVVVELGGGV